MQAYQARVDSFAKSSKRTKQSLNKSTAAFKWPHPATYKATPRALAEAGFYYDPSPEYRDNVSCFMCEKELADWDKNDDPFAIHWSKCGDSCAWAIVMCGLKEEFDESGNFHPANATRLPTSKIMEKARLETFTLHKSWPHDLVRGHGASSKRMAKAGFVYTPQSAGDDTATCFYCRISLSGWDEGDDPLEEHHKREMKAGVSCPFFAASNTSSVPLGKSTSKPPSSKTASKPPSRTTSQSKKPKHVSIEDEESTQMDSDDELAIVRPKAAGSRSRTAQAPSKRSTSSRASNVPSTATKTPSRRSTRGTGTSGKSSGSRATADSEVEDATEGSGSETTGKRVSKTKRKAKVNGKSRIDVIEEEEEDGFEQQGQDEEPVAAEKPKRGRPPGSKKKTVARGTKTPVETEGAVDDTDVEPAPVPSKPTHARTRSKANLESESDVPVPSSSKTAGSKTKVKKGKSVLNADGDEDTPPADTGKGSRKKTKKVDEDELVAEDFRQDKAKQTKGRTVSKTKSKARVVLSESDVDDQPEGVDEPEVEDPDVEEHNPSTRSHSDAKAANDSESYPSTLRSQSKPKLRKSSTTSDDAGYATAEQPMDIDEEEPRAPSPAPPPNKGSNKSKTSPSAPEATKSDNHQKNRSPASNLDRNPPEQGVDVTMTDSHVDRDSGNAPSIKAYSPSGSVAPAPAKAKASKPPSNANQTQPRPSQRSAGSSARPASRMASREMKVVDISSDEDEPIKAVAKVKANLKPPSRTSSPLVVSDIPPPSSAPSSQASKVSRSSPAEVVSKQKEPGSVRKAEDERLRTESGQSTASMKSRKGKMKMQVEVVIPVPSSETMPQMSPDVEMEGVEDHAGGNQSKLSDHHSDDHPMSAVEIDDAGAHSRAPSPLRDPSPTPNPPPSTPPRTTKLPSFNIDADTDADPSAEESSSDTPDSLTPFLSMMPIHKLTSLTEEESSMTLEQYIRREIELQYKQFKEDGEKRIAMFKKKAVETRRIIEAS